jgi:hypothetical protein
VPVDELAENVGVPSVSGSAGTRFADSGDLPRYRLTLKLEQRVQRLSLAARHSRRLLVSHLGILEGRLFGETPREHTGRLMVIGGGTSSLPSNVRLKLELLDERRFGNGVVYLRYRTWP